MQSEIMREMVKTSTCKYQLTAKQQCQTTSAQLCNQYMQRHMQSLLTSPESRLTSNYQHTDSQTVHTADRCYLCRRPAVSVRIRGQKCHMCQHVRRVCQRQYHLIWLHTTQQHQLTTFTKFTMMDSYMNFN